MKTQTLKKINIFWIVLFVFFFILILLKSGSKDNLFSNFKQVNNNITNCKNQVDFKENLWMKLNPIICENKTKNQTKKLFKDRNIEKWKYDLKDNYITIQNKNNFSKLIKRIEVFNILKNEKQLKEKREKVLEILNKFNNQKDLTNLANNYPNEFEDFLSLFKLFKDWTSRNPYIIAILRRSVYDNWKIKFLKKDYKNKTLKEIQQMLFTSFTKFNKNFITFNDYQKKYKKDKKK